MEKINQKIALTLLMAVFVTNIASPAFAKSRAEKDEDRRVKPKNNTLSRILGVTSAAGAAAVAVGKAGEKPGKRLRDIKNLTPAQKLMLAKRAAQFYNRIGKFQFNYGLSSNLKELDSKIESKYLLCRVNLPANFALRYENQTNLFSDSSVKTINKYLFEYNLRPVLTGQVATQIGALVGAKSTRVLTTRNEPTWGVSLRQYYLDTPMSLHMTYYASLVSISRAIMDSELDVAARFDWTFLSCDVGGLLDVTDMDDIQYSVYVKAGIHF
jgi:hypothetical protein